MAGSQDYAPDPRNDSILLYLNGDLVPRAQALVSIFDAGWILGDGVWEGLRVYNGKIAFLDRHLDRLWQGARAIDLEIGMTRADLIAALHRVLAANGMDKSSGAHIRLMITRGLKKTPNQDPRHTISGPTIAIVPEWKLPNPALWETGLTMFTSTFRSSRPDMFDMSLNTHSRLNFIHALIQAIKAGADEALMLDDRGYVSSGNATNFFIVKRGQVTTSSGRTCFNGITRQTICALCQSNAIPLYQGDFTLAEVYDADEAFVTGTFGGVTPVASVDGRAMGEIGGPVTRALREAYLGAVG